jgi:hypothetical protein
MEESRKYFQSLVNMHKDEWNYEYKYWDKKNRQSNEMGTPT